MLIFNEQSHPTIIDSVSGPVVNTHMWVLDMSDLDFMLTPINMLEEYHSPSMQVSVNHFSLIVPANWNVLVYDRDTAQIDIVEISETAGREFTAMVYGPRRTQATPATISIVEYYQSRKHVNPVLGKHQMLCHPISPTEWIVIGPSDGYSKYLKDRTVGDLI